MSSHESPTTVLDWQQLRVEVVNRLAAASAKGKAHWQRLLDLVDQRLAADPSVQAPPVDGRQWWLTEVRIEGFRGIPDSFELTLDPGAGLTVVHAPNGTGKSTIADAVRAALWGAPAPQPRELWQPVDRAVGAARARVEVRLRCGRDELRCVWTDDPQPHAVAVLASHDNEHPVTVADPDWQAALSAFTPVFSYAETQDRLGTPEALVKHLDDLLALGPCFVQLSEDVASRAAAAKESVARLQALKGSARTAIATVDAQFTDGAAPPMAVIEFPNRFGSEGPDNWLSENKLDGDLTTTVFSVTTEGLAKVKRQAEQVRDALGQLDDSETRLDSRIDDRLNEHLTELHDALTGNPPGGPCPVCGHGVDWWLVLSDTARRLSEWSTARRQVDKSARGLQEVHREHVRPLLEAARSLAIDPDGLADTLTDPPPDHGRTATDRARLGDVVDRLLGSSFSVLAHEVQTRGDHDRRWRAARLAAVDPFAQAWRDDGPVAVTANDWTQASKNLTVLRKELRDSRGTRLGEEVAEVLHRLLADTPLQLAGLTFAAADTLQLVGDDGGERRLGMLSAGQRNALVLAPLLRARSGGPFAFLVVDDPVHAFDDMRIDLVSDELVRLSADRRVVVLTHDSRLNEALVAKRPDTDVRTLTRDGGSVTADARKAPWVSLLDDAQDLVALGAKADLPAGLGRLPVLVRGMCRHAVEGALRGLALRWAVLAQEDLHATVIALDKTKTTAKRFTHASRYELPDRPGAAPAARAVCESYLRLWNEATHDTGGSSAGGLADEVRAARKACKLLGAWGEP
ncbi:AAA family ATPase [Pseudonocardia kunmingensis]|uniref:Nuclease SbcCD subunit C n=1 Tax=Pseudonocardia kunmingensis TaxID=630975 RepID=A0A543DNW2_9PSEU|nr:ATP-binding protein [Pseudonocardia kunmingensis]TQM10998.1 AAA domain-containing protein [Pseudonocardia kunmingensis]